MKDISYKLQAFGLLILEKLVILMGLRVSAFVLGILLMTIGIFTPPSFLAMRNIKLAFPKFSTWKRFKTVVMMWNNLGRSAAEFVCFNVYDLDLNKHIFLDEKSRQNLESTKNSTKGEIFFTAHFGNWEIFSHIAKYFDMKPFSAFYRDMNNKYANDIVLKYRRKIDAEMIKKGPTGAIKLLRSLKNGNKMLMFVDQRFSHDLVVPFFGIPSETTSSVATFALKYGYKVYSSVVFRRTPFSSIFDIRIEEFEPINTGNFTEDVISTTAKMNAKFEEWITECPEQWFWVHNRWKNQQKHFGKK